MDPSSPPKLELKMLVPLALIFFSKYIDFKNDEVVKNCQIGLVTVCAVLVSLHFIVYNMIKNDKTKIWIAKIKPTLPFGLGPPPDPLKVEDYEENTYYDHEVKLVTDAGKSILGQLAMALFMSWKFKVHMSLVMQAVMIPLNSMDNAVIKKYLFGVKTAADGGPLYKEELTQPTEKSLKELESKKEKENSTMFGKNEPRVEEITEEKEEKKESKAKESKTKADKSDGKMADLD